MSTAWTDPQPEALARRPDPEAVPGMPGRELPRIAHDAGLRGWLASAEGAMPTASLQTASTPTASTCTPSDPTLARLAALDDRIASVATRARVDAERLADANIAANLALRREVEEHLIAIRTHHATHAMRMTKLEQGMSDLRLSQRRVIVGTLGAHAGLVVVALGALAFALLN